MKKREKSKSDAWLALLRGGPLLLTAVVGLFWISSYFVGIQRYRSNWSASGSSTSEEARWFVSNYGSVGFAWRTQRGGPQASLPEDETDWKAFKGSSEALQNTHPDGFLSWHWIHHQPARSRMMGGMRTEYGHLYVPYWLPFFATGFFALLAMGSTRRRADMGGGTRSDPPQDP